ncbi:MAG: M15 family metallopeptidase [Clostridioides sp.]|jgi:hypothetical protein|nr:M15 family metallopeptidase [Clostridioides sp.]
MNKSNNKRRKKRKRKINKAKLSFCIAVLIVLLSGVSFAGYKILDKYIFKSSSGTKVETTIKKSDTKVDSSEQKNSGGVSKSAADTAVKPANGDKTGEDSTSEGQDESKTQSGEEKSSKSQADKDKKEEKVEIVFTSSEIPWDVWTNMKGKSFPAGATGISYEQLSYLKLTYFGFDAKPHNGEMIVNKEISDEVINIFKDLYKAKYPIEKMKLIDEYGGDDEASMNDNNTSAFCYRAVEGSDTLSKHALGLAVDINPLQNPHVKDGVAHPATANEYIARSVEKKGMVKKYDLCYRAFVERNWTWGGFWKNPDYQHFEK